MAQAENGTVVIEKTLSAPLERVWRAWTDVEQLAQWWGPAGVTNPTHEWDFRPGGKIYHVMLAGEELGELAGQEWPMTGTVEEVTPHERLVFTGSPIIDGKPVMETRTTVTFQEEAGRTRLTVYIEVVSQTPEAAGPLAGMEQGWDQQLDKLAVFVAQ